MNYADIAILVILVFSIVLGIIKGFWHTFSKIVTLIVAVVLGFMFAAELAPLIFQGHTLTFINSAVSKLIIMSDIASGVITQIGNEVYVASNGDMILIENALKTMLIPSFLHPTIIASIGGLNSLDGVTLGTLVSSTYTHLVTLVLTGGIIFFAGCIVMGVISALIGKAIKNGKINKALDKALGGILRIFTGFMFIIIILHVLGMLSGFDFMAPFPHHRISC